MAIRIREFPAQFMRDLYSMTGVELNLLTTYHPQTNRQTEQINQDVKQYLRLFINERLGRLATLHIIFIQQQNTLLHWLLTVLHQPWDAPL